MKNQILPSCQPERSRFTANIRRLAAAGFAFISASLIAPVAANADARSMVFHGNINSNSSCVIVVNQNGTMGVSGNFRQLSSKIAGGTPGKVTILQRGVYNIYATTLPIFMVAPTGGDTGVTRQVRYSGIATNLVTGFSVNIPEMAAYPGIQVNSFGMNSRTNLDIHFIADRPTAFPSGHYTSLVNVRCE